MTQPRVIGHVVSVHGFRLKVELSPESKSSSRATLDGVQRAVAINAFLTFDLGAGVYALGNLTDLEARESYDPAEDDELSLQLTKPRRIASVQLLGTVKQNGRDDWRFDPGITVLPTLDTPAEVANPQILYSIFSNPPERNQPKAWSDRDDGEFDFSIELGHQAGDENTKIKASFNDLFSRPLAIVGNTGSGKSYTVANLIRNILDNEEIQAQKASSPHIFVLDINGEYASAFLSGEEREYTPEPNEAYVNGKPLAVPIWLMNSEEISEWLSAAEQTQQPVLKAWWANLKSSFSSVDEQSNLLDEALAIIREMRPVSSLKKNDSRNRCEAIENCLSGSSIDISPLKNQIRPYFVRESRNSSEWKNFYGEIVTNITQISSELDALEKEILDAVQKRGGEEILVASGDTPTYVSKRELERTENLVTAASQEDAPKIDQHLTTLRLRLKARLADKRWSVFVNYDDLEVSSTLSWFRSIGFRDAAPTVTVLDLSMLAHEVLPFICAIIGRVLLEAREKLPASERYSNPWVLVLEEAHNYARPPRQAEDRGQALSRKAFERIAKEGRKFGLSLIVASQRPSEISPTIISQCANFLSHRLQNPDDIDHFRRIIPRQAQRLLDQVTVLSSGEAIAFGSAMHVPSRVQIRRPVQEPSSVTAAPYADWSKGQKFPISEVLEAWGVQNETNDTSESISRKPIFDDDLPF